MKKNTSLSNKDRGHFFSIFENEPLGVAQTASDDHLLMVNGTLCRMLGYQRRELLLKTFKELTHPDDRSREAEIIDKLLRGTETSYEIEKRYLRRYGSSVWVKETSSAVRGADGSFLHRISVIQVDQAKSAAERFRLAIEAAPNGMVLVDNKSRIVLLNTEIERIFHYRSEQLLGQRMETLLPDFLQYGAEEFPMVFPASTNGQASQMGRPRKLCGRRKGGALFPAEVGLNPMDTLKGTWLLSSIVDITERNCLEAPPRERERGTVALCETSA